MADLELARPVTPESRFRIGSCSKVVTSVIAMRLVEQGKVGLDAPIADYLPDLPEAHRRTTLRQLLGHQGGIRHYGMLDLSQTVPGGPIDVRQYRTTADALAIFIKDPLLAPPGEAVNYSTFGFTLIGAVLEKAAGVGFPELLEREIDAPLGLKFEAERPAKITPERVRPYDPIMGPGDPRTRAVIGVANAPPVNPAYKWPGGGQIARATDLAQFGAALLQPGLLKASSLEELFRPAPARKGPGPVPLGLAWRIDTDAKGRRRFNHAGSIAGGRSGVAIYPDAGIAIALCSNLSETPLDPMPTIAALADAFGA
jgi:CubicO group peptidase (beta-lactamase class C family)